MSKSKVHEAFVDVFLSPTHEHNETFIGDANKQSDENKQLHQNMLCESIFFEIASFLLPKCSTNVDDFFVNNLKTAVRLWVYRHFPFKINSNYSPNTTMSFIDNTKSGVPLYPENYVSKIFEFIDSEIFKSFTIDNMYITICEHLIILWKSYTSIVESYYYCTVGEMVPDIKLFKDTIYLINEIDTIYLINEVDTTLDKSESFKTQFMSLYNISVDEYLTRRTNYVKKVNDYEKNLKISDVLKEKDTISNETILTNILNGSFFTEIHVDGNIDNMGESGDEKIESDMEHHNEISDDEKIEGDMKHCNGSFEDSDDPNVSDDEMMIEIDGIIDEVDEPTVTLQLFDEDHITEINLNTDYKKNKKDITLNASSNDVNAIRLKELLLNIYKVNLDVYYLLSNLLEHFKCSSEFYDIYDLNWKEPLGSLLLFIVFNKPHMIKINDLKDKGIDNDRICAMRQTLHLTSQYIDPSKCIKNQKSIYNAFKNKDKYWFSRHNALWSIEENNKRKYTLNMLTPLVDITKNTKEIKAIIKHVEDSKLNEEFHKDVYDFLHVPSYETIKYPFAYCVIRDSFVAKHNEILDGDHPNEINLLFEELKINQIETPIHIYELPNGSKEILRFVEAMTFDKNPRMCAQLYIFLIKKIGFWSSSLFNTIYLNKMIQHYNVEDYGKFFDKFGIKSITKVDTAVLDSFKKQLDDLSEISEINGHIQTVTDKWTVIDSNDFENLDQKTLDRLENILFKDIKETKRLDKYIDLKHKVALKFVNTLNPKKYKFKISSLNELYIFGECNVVEIMRQVQLHELYFKKCSDMVVYKHLMDKTCDFSKLRKIDIDLNMDLPAGNYKIELEKFENLQDIVLKHYHQNLIDFSKLPPKLDNIHIHVYDNENMVDLLKQVKNIKNIHIFNHGTKTIRGVRVLDLERTNLFINNV
jgi:hypothetical protein